MSPDRDSIAALRRVTMTNGLNMPLSHTYDPGSTLPTKSLSLGRAEPSISLGSGDISVLSIGAVSRANILVLRP